MESQPEHFINLPLVNKNDENTELPLVIDVVVKYWGEDISAQAAGRASERVGAMIWGIEHAERLGFASYIYKSSTKDLKKRIDQGIPPIVIVPGIRGTVQHAMVVSGYNTEERRILTYVPEPDTVGAIPESKFDQDWEQDDMTAIVIIPSDMKDVLGIDNLKFVKSNRMCFEAEGLRQRDKFRSGCTLLQKCNRAECEVLSSIPRTWQLLSKKEGLFPCRSLL